jgi:hypothetical protein
MMPLMLVALLSAAPHPTPPLPDIPAPLGRLVDVLVEPDVQPARNEKIVAASISGCDHPVNVHVTHFVSGAVYAMQQLAEWLNQTPGLEGQLFARKGVPGEVIQGLSRSLPGDQHACAALPREVASAPKLCPGAGANEAWLFDGKKPVAFARWAPSHVPGKECLPRIDAVLFDSRGASRLRYEADFAGAVTATLVGDRCNIVFSYDEAKQVFHAERRGCKGP